MKRLKHSLLIFCILSSFLVGQETQKSSLPNWEVLDFGGPLANGEKYKIEKLVLHVPVNSKQICQGPVKGIFENDLTAFNKREICDPKKLELLEGEFHTLFRLQSDWTTSFGKPGRLTVVTNNGEFEIGITELGFTLGTDYPTNENTFYSWILAKLLDDEAKAIGKTGLKKKHFDVLSGIYFLDSSKSAYNAEKVRIKQNAR